MEKPNEDDYVVVMCPPYPQYKEQPKDQSHCELRDCPRCTGKMWLSEKKKGMLMFASCLNKNIILACYHCIEKLVRDKPEIFLESKRVNL